MQPEKFRPFPVGAKDFSPLRTTVGRCFYGLKNQQDELRVRRVRHAHHVFPRHRMRSRPPSLACACREHRGTVQRRMILLGAHGAPAGGAVLPGLLPICMPISQPHGLHGCCCRLAMLAGKALLAGGRDTDGGTCKPIPCGRFGAVFHPVRFQGG